MELFNMRALLADEMGLGKSIQALAAADKAGANTLIVCPAGLRWNWEEEVRTHLGFRANVLEGRTKKSASASWVLSFSRCTICSYSILDYWYPRLLERDFDMLIMDEAHYLCSRETRQYKNTKAISKGIRWKIAVTGTPMVNRPAELWPILNIIRPDKYDSFWSFAQEYCRPKMLYGRWDFGGVNKKALPKLHKELEDHVMIRRLKSDVLSQLPPLTRSVLPIPIDNMKEYKEAATNFKLWMQKNYGSEKAARAAKVEQLAKLGYLLQLAGIGKLPAVFDWIDTFLRETAGKLICFGIHKEVMRRLTERYSDQCVTVVGDTPSKERHNLKDKFNTDPDIRIFFGNIKAAGVGLSLKASTVAFTELAWTPGAHSQAEARGHGINRGVEGEATLAYYLVAHGTIETKLCKLIQEKQSTSRAILDGVELEDDLDLMDQLLEELRKAG